MTLSEALGNNKVSEQSSVSATVLPATIFLFLLLLIFALIFSISPINGEDYALSRIFDSASILDRAGWALEKSIHQYENWNARFGEQLSIFWLSMPKSWFTIATVISISLFSFLLALISTPEEKWSYKTLTLSCMLVASVCFLLWPRLEIFFWPTATAGYLQPMVLTLLLTLPFYSSRVCQRLFNHWSGTLSVAVLGLICGLSFENIPPSLIPYMAFITYINFKKKSRFTPQLILIILTYALGWSLLMLAPSTKIRTAYYISALHIPAPSLTYFFWQAVAVLQSFFNSTAQLLIALIATIAASLSLKIKTWRQPTSFYLLLIPSALCVASVVKAPYIEPRAFFLTWVILTIFLVRCANEVLDSLSDRFAAIVVIIVGIISLGMAAQIFSEYSEYARKISLRTESIMMMQGTNACRDGFPIKLIPIRNDIRVLNNREEWVGSSLPQVSKYFNCKLTIATPSQSEPK
ncbi:hypothetical protein HZF02_21240 [Pseudomonas yamanorum]|nr:hypothetical protein HZF02_21240 [Pseudomonas yamanorum]